MYYDYMLKYDPIRNIDLDKSYPSIYIYGNKEDNQVGCWQPYDYYNKIKESKIYEKGKSEIMINIKTKYGHIGSSNRYIKMREQAELYVVILEKCNELLNGYGWYRSYVG